MTVNSDPVWAVVPAAGSGSRMGASTPKQYLPLRQSTVIECTLHRLLSVKCIAGIVVAVDDDASFRNVVKDRSLCSSVPLHTVVGGDTRTQSVSNALQYLGNLESREYTVLVHDAARPCVRVSDIELLVDRCANSVDGGLLAIPVVDTLKRGDESDRVSGTIDRARAWRAATPQLFKLSVLVEALNDATRLQGAVAGAFAGTLTDEASAMENAGYRPQLIPCEADNIKITQAADLALANVILQAQQSEAHT